MADDSTWRRWRAGRCCCCGGELAESVNDVPCRAIGEGVLICGRCAEYDHDREQLVVQALLLSIATRDDAPLDEWAEHAVDWLSRS